MVDLEAPPLPSDDQIAEAAHMHTRMCECTALDGWVTTFRRDDLSFTGVWPADYDYGLLNEIDLRVEELLFDPNDVEGSWSRQLGRSRLAIKHAIERRDFELEQMREVLGKEEAD